MRMVPETTVRRFHRRFVAAGLPERTYGSDNDGLFGDPEKSAGIQ